MYRKASLSPQVLIHFLKQKGLQVKGSILNVKTKLIGVGVRDSCGKSASKGDPAGAMAPREESECPTFQSTVNFKKPKKTSAQRIDAF